MNNTQKIFFLIVLLVIIYYTQGGVEKFTVTQETTPEIVSQVVIRLVNIGSEQGTEKILTINSASTIITVKNRPTTLSFSTDYFLTTPTSIKTNTDKNIFYYTDGKIKLSNSTGDSLDGNTFAPKYKLKFKDGYLYFKVDKNYYLKWDGKFTTVTDQNSATKFAF
jgi:hypothetical protein